MGKHSCWYKQKLRKGLWSPEEDEKLLNYITTHGRGCWSSVPKLAGLQRCGKSCRLRWINYLRPDLKRGAFSQHEENLILELRAVLGNRWSQIAARLPGRTDNEIKNFWNSGLKKKLRQKGIDPFTHKPLTSQSEGHDSKNQPPAATGARTKPTSFPNDLNLVDITASAKSTGSICPHNSHKLIYGPWTTINPNPSFCFSSISTSSSDVVSDQLVSFLSSMSTTPLLTSNFVEFPTSKHSIGWELNYSFGNKESESNSIQSQNNNIYSSFYGNNSFPMGLAEDMKGTSECLLSQLILGNETSNQGEEVKPDINSLADVSSSSNWIPNQHQEAPQALDEVYGKDLQRLTVAFNQNF